jgi:hypothetical protein
VPRVLTVQCRCDASKEAAWHMALFCAKEARGWQHLRVDRRPDYWQPIGTNKGARKLAEWIIRLGKIGQFSLARRLLYS